MEAKFMGMEVVLASVAEGMFVRLRGTAVQPNSSIWDFGMVVCFVLRLRCVYGDNVCG